ncbi:PE family protein [Mycobacterium sp.]|uniref:PE family protein n=1 Tax=Mycobacterium sp. TaxID=1785 RepID=UPI003A89B865
MSHLLVSPNAPASAATDLAGIGCTLQAANGAGGLLIGNGGNGGNGTGALPGIAGVPGQVAFLGLLDTPSQPG